MLKRYSSNLRFTTTMSPENFRAAIIGGAVIDDPLSDYYENYIFTDYLSNELFAYDFKNNKLFTIPLPNLNTFYIISNTSNIKRYCIDYFWKRRINSNTITVNLKFF